MSIDTDRGAEIYVYDQYGGRRGITDSETGPGCCDIVYDELVKEEDGTTHWKRMETISGVDFKVVRALSRAVDLLEAWEGGKPVPAEVTVKIEVKANETDSN